MRFIGSKANLTYNIYEVVKENVEDNIESFLDLFSGTGVVAEYFKKDYRIISNDNLYFSYILQVAKIENNEIPSFSKLKQIGVYDPLFYLETHPFSIKEDYFITYNYSPYNNCERMYFTINNASRIDFIRQEINKWQSLNLINKIEYAYLLACLIEAIPYISNISGTYGAYLKYWDKRSLSDLKLRAINVINNNHNNKCYHLDANDLIQKVSGDLLYIDTPYNNRQYITNYHLLETIARYDYPKIYGKTGLRPYEELKSKYCIKAEVADAFEDIIKNAEFTHLLVSYSTDGLLTKNQIKNILFRYGLSDTFKLYTIPYRKYKSKYKQECSELYEYIIYIKKIIKNQNKISINNKNVIVNKYKSCSYIKSPLNYIGGKFKILKQIIPIFPQRIDNFIDLFAGGLNVGINVEAKRIYANDINKYVIEVLRTFKEKDIDYIINHIESRIEEFQLTKKNENGFRMFRDFYNQTKLPLDLYTLICYSFNYQFRFNNRHEFNNPFGRNRSNFSNELKTKLIRFIKELKLRDIHFSYKDFENFEFKKLSLNDLVYCDPPYLITTGSYNDGNRGFKDWNITQERKLLELLDNLDKNKIKFALSNVLSHKNNVNYILTDWSNKYNIHTIIRNYSYSSHNTIKGESDEVLITNY